MSNDRLNAIRERLGKATPGPWRVVMGDIIQMTDAGKGYPLDHYPDSADVVLNGSNEFGDYLGAQREEDATFIAHAPEDIAWLLERVEELERGARNAREALTVCGWVCEDDRRETIEEGVAELDALLSTLQPQADPGKGRE